MLLLTHLSIGKLNGKAFCFAILCAFMLVANFPVQANADMQSWAFWKSDEDEQDDDLLKEPEAVVKTNYLAHQAFHQSAFGELVYHYFQEDYQTVLQLIEVGRLKHQFGLLSQEDTDRLNLIQGASQLKLGMYAQSQAKFATLLSQTTSDYVQANTWFFMAKAGFENKQAYLSERAYAAILQGDLREELSDEQWYELLYLTAYTRMQAEQDWQSIAEQIPLNYIYSAYLLANQATILFNKGDFEAASITFTQAKQALLAFQNRRGFISKVAGSVFDSVTWFVTPWQWFDANATAQQAIKERKAQQSIDEQNALFDRINIGLGQSLLQQGDLPNAVAVIQTIADDGGEAEQALLTYGWANARENRWETAMSAWQHLQQNSKGLYALQANYGLAYAFSQQDNLGQAFYALKDTAQQIDQSLAVLDSFAEQVQTNTFFDDYQSQWPQELNDLRLGFFEPKQNFDAKYLLGMRQQASSIMQDIGQKQKRIVQLDNLLKERADTYTNRLSSLSLEQANQQIVQVQTYIAQLQAKIDAADNFEAQLSLSKQMASTDMTGHLQRLSRSVERHSRLAADTTRKRPLRSSYLERLNRIEGILTWQLMDNFIANRWQHQKLLNQAKEALANAKAQQEKLLKIGQEQDAFAKQRAQFQNLNNSLEAQSNSAQTVYANATRNLTQALLNVIEARKSQLQEQGVNTRLAMLRIQDLQEQVGR